jgi:ribosomal protein S27E
MVTTTEDEREDEVPRDEWLYETCPECDSTDIRRSYGHKGKVTESCEECGTFLAWG